jgi:hypothetical protein
MFTLSCFLLLDPVDKSRDFLEPYQKVLDLVLGAVA